MKMERSHFSSDYKFGVLYYKKGQTENEMFSNGEPQLYFSFLPVCLMLRRIDRNECRAGAVLGLLGRSSYPKGLDWLLWRT